jgi:hypothetical protein
MHRRLDVEEDRTIRERDKMSSSSGVGVDGMGRGRRELLLSETLINKLRFKSVVVVVRTIFLSSTPRRQFRFALRFAATPPMVFRAVAWTL